MKFTIYTDGGCSGNKRNAGCKGGYAYIILDPSGASICGGSGKGENTTNNKMEMMAVIKALRAMREILEEDWGGVHKHSCVLISDSKYIIDNYYEYLTDWKRNNWKKSKGGSVLNKNLWKAISELTPGFGSFEFKWVKGHSGNKYNTMVDSMAKAEFM